MMIKTIAPTGKESDTAQKSRKSKKNIAIFYDSYYTIHCARSCAFEIAWESFCTARTTA